MSTPSLPSEAAVRVRHFLGWLIALTFLFALIELVAFAATRNPRSGRAAAITAAFGAVMLCAGGLLRVGRTRWAVALISGGILAIAMVGVFVRPAMMPTLILLPLLAVMAAFTFDEPRALRPLMAVGWATGVVVAGISEWLTREGVPPADTVTVIMRVGSAAAGSALVLLLLWQFSRRLTDTLDETRAANLSLQGALSEVRKAEEQIMDLAYRDPLTALPNRLVFSDRLSLAVIRAHRTSTRLAVLFLDVDRFKVINDSLGHTTGDLLLQGLSARLRGCVREGDTLARLGGDEFVLLLPDVGGPDAAATVAEKVLDAVRTPFRLQGHELFVTASVGVGVYPEDGEDAETLVRNADTAMYGAKEGGRDTFRFYAPLMNVAAMESLAIENGLRKALARGELVLHYQPLVDLRTGQVQAVEALLRWAHPERGLLLPADFLAVAEATGLMVPIAPWALRTACAQVRAWQQSGHPRLGVAVNLSARQFQSASLVEEVRRALLDCGLEPRFLNVEVTESDAMQNAESAIARLRELKELGVRVSLDDFGTGYSSFSYLTRLPLDVLKIDQSFVRDITTDPTDATIVAALIAMAHTLKLQVVAEGVETDAQLRFLIDHGCDAMQGRLASMPVDASICADVLAEMSDSALLADWGSR